jgi:hypothetical protein
MGHYGGGRRFLSTFTTIDDEIDNFGEDSEEDSDDFLELNDDEDCDSAYQDGDPDGVFTEKVISDALRKERTWVLADYMIKTLSKHRMKELLVILKEYCEGVGRNGAGLTRERLRSRMQIVLGPHSPHFMSIFNRYWHGKDFVIEVEGDYLNDEQCARRTIVNALRWTASSANLDKYTNSEVDERVLDLYGYIYNLPSDIYRDLMRKLDCDRAISEADLEYLKFRYEPLVNLILWTLRLEPTDSRPDIPRRSIDETLGDHNDSAKLSKLLLRSVELYLGPGFDHECLDELARTPDFKSSVVIDRMVRSLPNDLLDEVIHYVKDLNLQLMYDGEKNLKASAQNNFCKHIEQILKSSSPALFADICKNAARLNPSMILEAKQRYSEVLKDQWYCKTVLEIRAESHHVQPNSQYQITDDMGIGLYWQDLVNCYQDKSLPHSVSIDVPLPPLLQPLPQHAGTLRVYTHSAFYICPCIYRASNFLSSC